MLKDEDILMTQILLFKILLIQIVYFQHTLK